jgi:pseudaminic acid cytidylyltransferase
MKIAIIPARGGSKRIPRKNIKTFCGKPMIAWSIEAAKSSGIFDRIIVTTDDIEIAEIAKKWGAEAPFIRPPHLSDDFAGTSEVVAHALQWYLDEGHTVSAACCIYATAPFVQVEDLVKSYELLMSAPHWSFSLTATDFAAPIFRSFKLIQSGGIEMYYPEFFSTRSQDLPKALHDAGQFYWGRTSAWLNGDRFFEHHTIPLIIPRWRVQDIDNLEDWKRAETIASSIFKQP